MRKKSIFVLILVGLFSVSCVLRNYQNAALEEYYLPPTITVSSLNPATTDGPYQLVFSVQDISGLAWFSVSDESNTYKKTFSGQNTLSNSFISNYYFSTVGQRKIIIQAQDSIGAASSTKLIINVNINPPTVTILDPSFDILSNTTSYTLKGIAYDVSNHSLTSLLLFTNGTDKDSVSLSVSNSNWNYVWSNLKEGTNSFFIQANSDSLQTTTSPTRIIVVDTTGPEFKFDNLSNNGELVTGNSIKVKCYDQYAGVAWVSLYTNGSFYQSYSDPYQFEYFWPNLPFGTNTLSLRGSDRLGQTNTPNTISVVVVAYPYIWQDISSTNRSTFTLTGSANIDPAFKIVNVEVNLDNAGFNTASFSTNSYTSWSYNVSSLSEGNHSIILKATGDNSKTTTVTNNITIDLTPPNLVISSPTNNEEIFTNTYSLSGTVSDTLSGLNGIWISTYSNPFFYFYPSSNPWTKTLSSVSYGKITNLIYAIDYAGNSSATQTIVVERKATPNLTINDPSDTTNVNTTTITLTYSFNIAGSYQVTNISVTRDGSTVINQTLAQSSVNNASTGNITLTPDATNTLITTILANSGLKDSVTNLVICDPNAPTITISNPTANSTVTNPFTFSGSASDFSGVRRLTFLTNAGVWKTLSNTSSWSLSPILIYTNHLGVIAEDTLSNISTNWVSNINVVDIPSGVVYVASWGQSNWSGSEYFPLNQLPKGVNTAVSRGIHLVKIQKAIGSAGNGLNTPSVANEYSALLITNNDLTISGGWNSNFTTQVDNSTLDGQNSYLHLINIQGANNILIEHLSLINGGTNGALGNTNGAGLFLSNVSSITLFNLLVATNHSSGNGTGVAIQDSTNIEITNCLIQSNTTISGGKGGGVAILRSIAVRLKGVYLFNNKANGEGGGIFIKNSTNIFYGGGILTNNYSASSGGGIAAVSNTNVTIFYSTLFANIANGSGGGLSANGNQGLVIQNSAFSNQYANDFGGGAFFTGGANMVSNSTFTMNDASSGGSALALFNTAFGVIIHNALTNQHGTSDILVHKDLVPPMILFISNNLIGMDGDSSTYGIYEDTNNGGQNIDNTTLADNVFFTNTLEFLMREASLGGKDITNITTVNSNDILGGIDCVDTHDNIASNQ